MKPGLVYGTSIAQVWPTWEDVPPVPTKMRPRIVEVDDDAKSGWAYRDGKAIRPKTRKERTFAYYQDDAVRARMVEKLTGGDPMWTALVSALSELTGVSKEKICEMMTSPK